MAARIKDFFDSETSKKIINSKLLLVGAGGIGCELLKGLILAGFENIDVIDLDTIDLSNLNRQFLFHKQHIGKPKAVVARESVLKFNQKANITAYHDSITSPKYNVEFYRKFDAVINALDNISARSHVNRMCMATDKPLIESGSAGFLGQTTVYKKKETECFECLPKKLQKTYPSCTIRNTPTQPVHCIVWAKHLFNQLFGESDDDEDVSPDVPSETGSETIVRVSTRLWAVSTNYDAQKIFNKLFYEDILYLNQMQNLWEQRAPPKPIKFEDLLNEPTCSTLYESTELEDLRLWTLKECGEIFVKCLNELKKRVQESGPDTVLTWDKDDDVCLDFNVACSNLRSYCFAIPRQNKFNVKEIAGNIIPAIATTNAIVAGLVVLQVIKVVKGNLSQCKTAFLNESYVSTKKLFSAAQLEKPNPICLVCSSGSNEVIIKLNMKTVTLRTIEDKIMKEMLHMVQPDAFFNDGSATIVLSSDPEEMSEYQYGKTLTSFRNETDDVRLLAEDFLQNFKIHLVFIHEPELSGQEFKVISELHNIKPDENAKKETEPSKVIDTMDIDGTTDSNTEKKARDNDLVIEPELKVLTGSDDENGVEPPMKKVKV